MGRLVCFICRSQKNYKEKPRLFRFPRKSEMTRRKAWASFCQMEENEICDSHRLCVKHFDENAIRKRKLTRTAVPTLERSMHEFIRPSNSRKCVLKCELGNRDSLFAFPTSDVVKEAWAEFCDLPVECILTNHRLCSKHFEKKCFKFGGPNSVGKAILREGVLPSIKDGMPGNGDVTFININDVKNDDDVFEEECELDISCTPLKVISCHESMSERESFLPSLENIIITDAVENINSEENDFKLEDYLKLKKKLDKKMQQLDKKNRQLKAARRSIKMLQKKVLRLKCIIEHDMKTNQQITNNINLASKSSLTFCNGVTEDTFTITMCD